MPESTICRKYPLRVLFWESTLKCNAFCEFCGSRCGEADTAGELTADEICGLFREVAARYDPSGIMINVSGGEPLMRKDLFGVMAYANSLGYPWGLVTNGTLLTDDVISELDRCQLRTISISIDGIGPVHDQIRRFPGAFDRIVAGIQKLRRIHSLDTVMITTVVSRHNLADLAQIRDYLCSLPIDVWRVCPVDPIGRARNRPELALDADEVVRVLDFIEACRSSHRLPYTVTTSCSHYLGRYEGRVRDYPFQCFAGKQIASVLANGDIYVCANVPKVPELIQGNVRTDRFVDVWEQEFQYFRDDFSRKTGKCRACPHFSACRADSLHTWDFERNTPGFCMRELALEAGNGVHDGLPGETLSNILNRYRVNGGPIRAKRIAGDPLVEDVALLSPQALRDLQSIFTPEHTQEQIACLIGRLYRNTEADGEAFLAEVHSVRELKAHNTSSRQMLVEEGWIGQGVKLAAAQCAQLLGFVHSHPGELSVAMSVGDFRWHKTLYETDWKMAMTVIVNPQKQLLSVYAGPSANRIETYLLL